MFDEAFINAERRIAQGQLDQGAQAVTMTAAALRKGDQILHTVGGNIHRAYVMDQPILDRRGENPTQAYRLFLAPGFDKVEAQQLDVEVQVIGLSGN